VGVEKPSRRAVHLLLQAYKDGLVEAVFLTSYEEYENMWERSEL
jgi:hypothetical protein